MQISDFIISLVYLISLLIAVSFFKKKGENLATKQDIEEITKKIEGVKSGVEVLTKGEIEFRADKKKALINFYDAFIFWYEVILELSNHSLDVESQAALKDLQGKIEAAYKEVLISERRLELYFSEDDVILDNASRLLSIGVKVDIPTTKFLIEINQVYQELNEYHTVFQSGVNINLKEVDKLNKKEKQLWSDITVLKGKYDQEIETEIGHFIIASTAYLRGNRA